MDQMPLRSRILALLLFLVLALIAYGNTLNSTFHFDDEPIILDNPYVHLTHLGLSDIVHTVSGVIEFSKRPVGHVSFALNYYFHQDDVTGYHVINIVIHVLAATFLYLFVRTTLDVMVAQSETPRTSKSWNSRLPKPPDSATIAFLAVLIWLVHPIHTQSVTYIVQRMNSMAAMFYVLSMFLYVKGRLVEMGGKRWLWFVGCAVSGLLALGSKEIAATLPFFILLYEWYFFQHLSKTWLKRYFPYIAGTFVLFGAIALLYLGSNPLEAVLSTYKGRDFTLVQRVLTQFRVLVFYISLLIYPHPSRLNLEHDFALSQTFTDPITTLISLTVVAGLVALAVLTARRRPLLSFSILWFFGNLLIESSVIGLEIIYEHRTYLPSMAFVMSLVVLAHRHIGRKQVATVLACAVVTVFCVWAHQRNSVWADEVTLWADCVQKSPKKRRPREHLGNALSRKGFFDRALVEYNKALKIDPNRASLHFNVANTLARQAKLEEAILHFSKALSFRPDHAPTHNALGAVLEMQGKLEEAIAHYEEALRIKPSDRLAGRNLAFALARKKGKAGFVHDDKNAIRSNAGHGEGRFRLKPPSSEEQSVSQPEERRGETVDLDESSKRVGEYLSQAGGLAEQGRLDEATGRLSKALALEPDNPTIHYALGVVSDRQGKLERAAACYLKALDLNPDYAHAHNNLGIVLAKQGRMGEAISHFSEALRIRPHFTDARKNLERAILMQRKVG